MLNINKFLFSLYYGCLIECVKLVSGASCFSFFSFSHSIFLLFQSEKCFSKKKKDEILVLMKNALIAATNILRKNPPLESTLVKDISCLSPTVRNKDWAIGATGRLAERFSHVIEEWNVSVIKAQWVFIKRKRCKVNGIRILSLKILNVKTPIGPRFWT